MATLAPVHEAAGGLSRAEIAARVAVAAAGCAAAVAAFELTLLAEDDSAPRLHASLVAWITFAYVMCGLIVWSRQPASRFGPLMIVAGFTPVVARLEELDDDVLHAVGEASRLLPPALFLHVFLAYPSGRLVRRFDRLVVAWAYGAVIGLDVVRVALAGGGAAAFAADAQRTAVAVAAIGCVAAVVSRREVSRRPRRRSRGLVIATFALAAVAIAAGIATKTAGGPAVSEARWLAFALIGAAPVLLVAGFLRARLARTAVGDLVIALQGERTPFDVQEALARALRDPSLRLAYWLDDFGRYADVDGQAVDVPQPGGERAVTAIDRDGRRVAALVHDASLLEERRLLDAVSAAAGVAIENAQLHVELRARLEEVRGSRARVIEAGQRERQRLERDLHDGAQQRLVALALNLRLLERRLHDAPARDQLAEAQREVELSLAELRDLAHGIHPAVVTSHGLAVALEQVAARATLPVRLTVDVRDRLPQPVEVAAYYVITECLANVAKHAHATHATVGVARFDGRVTVEVVDDGVGGADSERGSGLRGLADRVEALGGRLRVWTPHGGGTRVRAEIPCG